MVSSFEETLPKDSVTAAEYATLTALHKAQDVAGQLVAAARGGGAAQQLPLLVIGADTVVEYGEHILEKPADAADATRMLRMLSGQRHHVHTGVAMVMPQGGAAAAAGDGMRGGRRRKALRSSLAWPGSDLFFNLPPPPCPTSDPAGGSELPAHCFAATTTVLFDELSEAAMQAYVASGEPYDKAGGYGEGRGGLGPRWPDTLAVAV